jgi:transcriptional regulator with XRE-family HTH domain
MDVQDARLRELGDFLRAQRSRLDPAGFGLPAGTRRRTPGLRREEVAQLCGMSATWYCWIEQGRPISVSPQALARLAQTLRLSQAERAYLFDLAGKRDPKAQESGSDADLPPALVASVASIAIPAYLLDRAWNALAWNAPAQHLFVGWLDGDHDRNLLRYIFVSAEARSLIRDWELRARRALAEFRAETSMKLHLPELDALVADLTRVSPLFARAWQEHAVLGREGGQRGFDHPAEGRLAFEQVSLAMVSRPDLKLVMLVPADNCEA